MKQMTLSLGLVVLSSAMLGCVEPGGSEGDDKDRYRGLGQADGVDPCAANGWYGDGECDRFCAQPDSEDCVFFVIGHRGAPFAEVENTLPAFDATLALGGNSLEIDLCLTSDGHVVVWHDRDPDDTVALARQAGAEGLPHIPYNPDIGDPARRPVDELTLEELRREYGYARSEGLLDDILQPQERLDDAWIPTFDEVAAWAREQADLRAVFLDVKLADDQEDLAETLAAVVMEQVREAAAAGPWESPYQIFFLSPHESIITTIRDSVNARYPDHHVRFVIDFERSGALEATRRLGFDAISTGATVLRSFDGFLEEIRATVPAAETCTPPIDPVVAWTIDDDGEVMDLLDAGVHGIMTNRPDQVARLVERGWAEHVELVQRIARCWEDAAGGPTRLCFTMDELHLTAPLEEDQTADWVCDRAEALHLGDPSRLELARDLFGCAFLTNREVRFEAPAESRADLAMWLEAGEGLSDDIVVIGATADAPR